MSARSFAGRVGSRITIVILASCGQPRATDQSDGNDALVCTPSVSAGGEDTAALCANGVDDDCNHTSDCADPGCAATVACANAMPDAGALAVGPDGGAVTLLHFGVFGDARPASPDQTAGYPTMVLGAVMDAFAREHAQFVVASGDYMFASGMETVTAQLDLLAAAEARFGGAVFHAFGNHECTGATASNCPVGDETANVQQFRVRLANGRRTPYYDVTVGTSLGDAHFVLTAPNAWSDAQSAWLTDALARDARYTIVIAHEPAGQRDAMGSVPIETAIAARRGGVTLRIYGHTHYYKHPLPNGIVVGNAGAPLQAGGAYGYVTVDQRADANLVVTAYELGSPPSAVDSFVLSPAGSLTQ